MMAWSVASLLIAAAAAGHGLRKQSLSPAGAATAFVVGSLHLLCGPRFGATLLTFYFTSSQLTKYRTDVKARIEEGYKKHGQRTPVQVLANSLGGCATALLARLLQARGSPAADATLLAFLGHFACCCADTWSSELGVLSARPPRLITTGREVPRGTNGGVSPLGTAAGAAGGLAMGAAFWAAGCFTSAGRLPGAWLPGLGLALGLLGTAADSLLGATCQFSGYSQKLQRVVSRPGPGVAPIAGRPLLSNDGVNVAAAALTALAGAGLALLLAR